PPPPTISTLSLHDALPIFRIFAPLTITTASLPPGVVGTAYNLIMASNGGATPVTWTATGLPAGLSISASGAISGTPTTAGTSTADRKRTRLNSSHDQISYA